MMDIKIISGILMVVAAIAMVSCEVCTTNDNCNSTLCATGSVICQHPDGEGITLNGGLCTCSDSQSECTTRADCYSLTTLACQATLRHCYDNKCVCDRYPVG